MAETDFEFRRKAVKSLTTRPGVYVLCDLDSIPIYVGKSVDGIRSRVARHLTSARSDIIANRQIDVWEIAYVHAYPLSGKAQVAQLESDLFYFYNKKSALMNGTAPPRRLGRISKPSPPKQIVQVMSADEIRDKRLPTQRLPRQATHYAQLVSHFLTVKNSYQVARAMKAHFERLSRYHERLLSVAASTDSEPEGDS